MSRIFIVSLASVFISIESINVGHAAGSDKPPISAVNDKNFAASKSDSS